MGQSRRCHVTELELFINTKTAKTRGLTIPQSVLLRVDRREGCAQALTERGPMEECRHTVAHPVQSFAWPPISDPVAAYMWVV